MKRETDKELRGRGLQRAIDSTAVDDKPGTISALAKLLGISRQAVSQWDCIPLERVLEIEEKTNVPRQELRPDFYSSKKG